MTKYGPKLSREELKAQAAAALTSFAGKGGTIDKRPAVEVRTLACKSCGHVAAVAVHVGRAPRCPQCRERLKP